MSNTMAKIIDSFALTLNVMCLLFCFCFDIYLLETINRADSRLAPCQWEMLLQCNAISHWLGANLELTWILSNLSLMRVKEYKLVTNQTIIFILSFPIALIQLGQWNWFYWNRCHWNKFHWNRIHWSRFHQNWFYRKWFHQNWFHQAECLIIMGCINSLRPSDAIWWHRSGSTLAQVMACCLTAASHYLNQSWQIISEVQWHSYQGNFTRDVSTINH